MKRTLLLLDTSFLAYRAYYSTGHLSYKEVRTGVVYGILTALTRFKDQFDTDHVAFCFDSKYSLRKELFAGYKGDRSEGKDEDELRALGEVKNQLTKLRKEYLPDIGFRNLFIQKGYEADDIIAKLSQQYGDDDTDVIIISSDSDYFQLLNDNVAMWDPRVRKLITPAFILRKYGILPEQWAQARALAGGKDGLKGVPRVGLKTACKYILHELPDEMKRHIDDYAIDYYRSKQLVTLPFPGVKPRKLKRDEITKKSWEDFTTNFGLRSMKKYIPIRTKGRRRLSALKKPK